VRLICQISNEKSAFRKVRPSTSRFRKIERSSPRPKEHPLHFSADRDATRHPPTPSNFPTTKPFTPISPNRQYPGSDSEAKHVTLPASLTRRRILEGATSLAVASILPGCSNSTTSSTPTTPTPAINPQPTPTGPFTQSSLTVSTTSAGSIGPAFAGLSYEKNTLYSPLFTASNSDLIALFKRLGASVLRVGGNSVDENVWNPTGPGQTSGQIAPTDVAALAAFVKATGWQILYGINLGGSATGVQTLALAAAEVAYAVQQFGSSLLGIEIGNECDLYGDTGSYYAGNWTLAKFEALWSQYRTAILATTPAAPITGPVSAGNITTWTIPFGQYVTKTEITLLTQHYYRANGALPTSTDAYLITADPTLVNNLSELNTGAKSIGIPYRIAECNSFYNGGSSGVSDSYASSLWVIDYLFDCAQGGASGVNFHGGGNSAGYTPIANSGATIVAARPEYYGILLFTLAGTGTILTTSLTAGSLNATAYAVKTASGTTNLVLVNKDSTQNLSLTAQLPQTINSATLLQMTQSTAGAAPSLSATSGVTIQSATVNPDATFTPAAAYTLTTSGTQLTCYVPALTAVLISIT
jgi:hypothetical protein